MNDEWHIIQKHNLKQSVRENLISQKRFIKVLFSDEIRPLLATRGTTLTKEESTKGFKTNEYMYRSIIKQYNNAELHNSDQFPRLLLKTNVCWTTSKKYLVASYPFL